MSSLKTTDGYIEWNVPGVIEPCKTWYRVYGDLKSGRAPVLALHGGPGFACDYMMCMRDLTASYSIPVIVYDQIGIGRSSHVPEKKGDTSFWTCELFLDEIDTVIKHFGINDSYSVVGQSWGGMLAAMHAIRQPKGLKKLVLANSLSDIPLFIKGVKRLREALPQDVQDEMKKHEDAGTTDSEEYEKCVDVYFAKHIIRMDPMPDEFVASAVAYKEDKNVYSTMLGPSEFFVTGTLKEWNITKDLHKINVDTLLANGRYDEVIDETVMPLFLHIPRVRWMHFSDSSHLPQFEERERYMMLVGEYLLSK